jgi:5-methylcytosine-specific restriction endonuclease McrA
MCYNSNCHTSGNGALFVFSADGLLINSISGYWVKHPVLLDERPAACVTTSANNTGCFVMTRKDGKPCKKCGTSKWREDNGDCVQCGRNRALARYHSDPESAKKRRQDWSEKNRLYERERNRAQGYSRKYKQNNKEKVKETNRRWGQNNKDKVNAKTQKYRAAKAKNGGSYTAQEWRALCEQYEYRCVCCGKKAPLAADHVVPVSKGGSSNISNIQPLCKTCNTRKLDKTIDYRTKPGIKKWIQKALFGE